MFIPPLWRWLFLLLLLPMSRLGAQVPDDSLMRRVPAIRQWHHEQVLTAAAAVQQGSFLQTPALVAEWAKMNQGVYQLRTSFETDPSYSDNDRFFWLRGLQEWLAAMAREQRQRKVFLSQPSQALGVFSSAVALVRQDASLAPLVKAVDRMIGLWICDNFAFAQNQGIPAARDFILVRDCALFPQKTLLLLDQQPFSASVDSLLVQYAFRDPEGVYKYAAAESGLGKKIQSNPHPLVQCIARLALNRYGRLYFPFLDELYHQKIKMEDINPLVVSDTSMGYFKLLVSTRVSYAKRMQMGDTPLAVKALTSRLKSRAIEQFVNPINALHAEKSTAIRFRVLDSLRPTELYYLAVLGEEELYTSSFVNGIYPKIFQNMVVPRGDLLLADLSYDYAKKFIRLAAAYNVLDNFLQKMEGPAAEKLMRQQVKDLEKSLGLEDAVDAVDTYASLGPNAWRSLMWRETQLEFQRCQQIQHLRGKALYGLMLSLFRSLDQKAVAGLWDSLQLNPPDRLLLKTARDSVSGRVVVQQYFYGDKDGQVVFQAFLSKYTPPNWKIIKSAEWVEIQSTKGIPVSIFANYPLDEKTEADEQAQDNLNTYLHEKNISPAIVVHRGHSYYLNSTIRKLPETAQLVLLGSCGGYQKLQDVLAKSPHTQIIASKQIGAGVVNQGMVTQISEALRQGKDLYWPLFWVQMEQQFTGKARESFKDYVPPQRNLGALFIRAFQNWENQGAVQNSSL
ncbi:MAG: hypothetical protein EAZ62_00540 [Sphingobacteriia bacterium]|nr:MAG: hypothetical protein EAZ62_00540 [Sphingobacteriia bacterium]